MFSSSSGLQAITQQLLQNVQKFCGNKTANNNVQQRQRLITTAKQRVGSVSTEQAFEEMFSFVDKDQFTKLLSDVNSLPRRLIKQKRFDVSLGNGNFLLFYPQTSRIFIQTRGFRTRAATGGFNRRNTTGSSQGDEKPHMTLIDSFLANLNMKTKNDKRNRQEVDQFNAYKSELDNISDAKQQRIFADGFVKGLLSKSANEKQQSGAVPKKMPIFRNLFIFFLSIIAIVFYTGLVQVRVNGKRVGSFMFPSPQEIRPEDVFVTFEDVRGMEEAKHEVTEIVNYLRDPARYSRLGGRLPKGVLLAGPPGTGKTLLARAIAGEAGVPFFHASGSEFDEVLVGQGARRVRDLFEKAKEREPCIIFIDEIDSVGAKRISNGVHPYANQTINQLLSEMDGFEKNEGIIVIGATNRVEDLDKALLRPGRFDVRVTVTKPDLADRIDIFTFYLKKVVHDKNINPANLAKGTPGFTGADIENMVNQAALKAATEGCKKVLLKHLEEAKDRIIMGPARFRGVYNDHEINNVTAFHEAGHTLVALFTEHAVPLHKVTIIPRGQSLGHTALLPEKDQHQVTRAQMLAQMDMLMGGRVAEELIFGEDSVTTGPGSDLKKATELAIAMVMEYGMSKRVGLRDFTVDESTHSSQTAESIDAEVNRILQESHKRAKNILTKYAKEHELLAKALLQYETLTADEVQKVIQGEDISQQKKAQIEHKLADDHARPAVSTPKRRHRPVITIEKDITPEI